jgi:hypothetical protein
MTREEQTQKRTEAEAEGDFAANLVIAANQLSNASTYLARFAACVLSGDPHDLSFDFAQDTARLIKQCREALDRIDK